MSVDIHDTRLMNPVALAIAGGLGVVAALFGWLWSSHGVDLYLGYLSGAAFLCM